MSPSRSELEAYVGLLLYLIEGEKKEYLLIIYVLGHFLRKYSTMTFSVWLIVPASFIARVNSDVYSISQTDIAQRWDIRISEPHIIVMIEHEYVADEKISRAEVSTILAVMITQLRHGHLEEHCIPPVSAFYGPFL